MSVNLMNPKLVKSNQLVFIFSSFQDVDVPESDSVIEWGKAIVYFV